MCDKIENERNESRFRDCPRNNRRNANWVYTRNNDELKVSPLIAEESDVTSYTARRCMILNGVKIFTFAGSAILVRKLLLHATYTWKSPQCFGAESVARRTHQLQRYREFGFSFRRIATRMYTRCVKKENRLKSAAIVINQRLYKNEINTTIAKLIFIR